MVPGGQVDLDRNSAASPAPLPKLNLRRLEKIQRLLQYGATVVLVVFLGLIALSAYGLKQLNNQIDLKNRELADKRVEHEKMDQALRQKQKELEQKEAQYDFVNGLLGEQSRDLEKLNPRQASDRKEAVEQAVEKTAQDTRDNLKIPPRIYFHIAREDQRERARQLARQLQAKGYVVPGIENVQGKANIPHVSQLRYYQNSEKKDLDDIGDYLRAKGIPFQLPPALKSGGVRPRHYELWLGEAF